MVIDSCLAQAIQTLQNHYTLTDGYCNFAYDAVCPGVAADLVRSVPCQKHLTIPAHTLTEGDMKRKDRGVIATPALNHTIKGF